MSDVPKRPIKRRRPIIQEPPPEEPPKESTWTRLTQKARAAYKRLNPETKPCLHCGAHIFPADDVCRWCKRNVHEPLEKKPCPHCNQDTPADRLHCEFCGKRLVPIPTYPCPHCGEPVKENAVWCPNLKCNKASSTVPCYLCGTPRHPSSLWCPSCGEYEFSNVLWFVVRLWLVIGLISAFLFWIGIALLINSGASNSVTPSVRSWP